MKKFIVLACALIPAFNTFAYYSDYSDDSNGLFVFFMIAYIIICIIFIIRWWKMTKNIDRIYKHLTNEDDSSLTYLVAIGEKEKAEKAALKRLVDQLYPIYNYGSQTCKAEEMNTILEYYLPQITRLGITLPEYITSGEKFINYMNELTGRDDKHSESNENNNSSNNDLLMMANI